MFIQVAPMEGVVDFKVRELLTHIGGIDRTVTEFVRVTNRLLPAKTFLKYCPELTSGSLTQSKIPVFMQLLGSDPSCLAENAEVAVRMGAYGIDLNFGCPAKTVNRHDGGSTLLKNPERVFRAVEAVKKAVGHQVEVTAKVRLGFENKDLHKDIAQAVDSAGANQLVIHARTKSEGYKPPAHWEYIGFMKDVTKSVRVVANGDIWSVEDYKTCVSVSGVKDVALGRAIVSRPDLALLIRNHLRGETPTAQSWNSILKEYVWPLFDFYFKQSQALACGRLKQCLKALSRNYIEAKQLFEDIKRENLGVRLKQRLLRELALTNRETSPIV